MGTSMPTLSTAILDMTSLSISGRQQIAQTCKCWVFYSGRDFSITVKPILNRFTVLEIVIQGLQFFFCNVFDIFAA